MNRIQASQRLFEPEEVFFCKRHANIHVTGYQWHPVKHSCEPADDNIFNMLAIKVFKNLTKLFHLFES